MKKPPGGFSPVIALDRKAAKPLHRQIYDGYRALVVERNMRPGQQIPSSRALAVELGISRIPVLNAYAQLLAEGYFESRAGSGTFVSSSLPEHVTRGTYRGSTQPQPGSGPRVTSRQSNALPRHTKDAPWLSGVGAFSVGQLAYEDFPFQVWSGLVARHCRNLRATSLNYGDTMGSIEFRESIAAYLRTARAVRCEAEQIMIVSGSQQALEISARVLLDPGSHVWIEEPGYPFMQHGLTMAGCNLIPVPVDDEGLNVAAGIKLCRKARAAYVTPSHQYPLGVTMSASRRLQLLDWAQNSGSWIIEDDYDSEYRYETMPIASLQGLDRNARVIYVGTFSKILFPSLRTGYIVVPTDLIEHFSAIRFAMDIFPPQLYQAVLTDFINEGHFARYIRRTRQAYSLRRSALVHALRDEFGSSLAIRGAEAGMHLVVTLPSGMRDREISARAATENLWLWPLSSCYLGAATRQGLILGFGGATAADMPRAVRRLRGVLTPP
jgi:GntR family transcriptional regulator/MocR family aminotransferase